MFLHVFPLYFFKFFKTRRKIKLIEDIRTKRTELKVPYKTLDRVDSIFLGEILQVVIKGAQMFPVERRKNLPLLFSSVTNDTD